MGIGCPDLPTPQSVLDHFKAAIDNTRFRLYPSSKGLPELRATIAEWFETRFGVLLDPEEEILPVLGSKDAIAHLPFAILNPGDGVLCPNPGYPVYFGATTFAGGSPIDMPLLPQNNYLPALSELSQKESAKVKLMYTNYPHNPTGATCEIACLREIVEFARSRSIILCHDAAYSELAPPSLAPSIMQVKGGKEIGIEVYSFSKTYNMAGWRLGFAVGNKHLIAGLRKTKGFFDSGIFGALQSSGVAALQCPASHYNTIRQIYEERRERLTCGLARLGLFTFNANATFFVWVTSPSHLSSEEFAALLADRASIICVPGTAFGNLGEGYVRFSLTISSELIDEALKRMESRFWLSAGRA